MSFFTTNYDEIIKLIDTIDPIKYGKTRNYLDGAVTKLSPYISRGVISTKQIAIEVLKKGYKPQQIEIFLKELAWRDYFQQVWIAKKDEINKDVKQEQPKVSNYKISSAIVEHKTQIDAIDKGIMELYQTGYMHNHVRMYLASLCCNIAQSHWYKPAQWLYYHLIDADWASNALSWQWVAGSFSSKKYYANQENISKFCNSNQRNSYLNVAYEVIEDLEIPEKLKNLETLQLKTTLPTPTPHNIDPSLPIYIYNFYNLDVSWFKGEKANRILLLEPSFFEKYPVGENSISFILQLSKNIENIQIVVGEFNEVFKPSDTNKINFKEHPTCTHYKGTKHNRDWMFEDVTGYYPSFFAYWKKCEKNIEQLIY